MPAPNSLPRSAAVWEWLQAVLLVANLAWTTLCLGGYRPETMVATTALTGALVATYFLARASGMGGATHDAGWLLLPFLAYAAANVAWVTPVRWLGWRDWIGWAQMVAVFWVTLNGLRGAAARRFVGGALVAIGAVTVALACYQRLGHEDWMMLQRHQVEQFIGRASGSFGIPNSFAAFLLLLLPPLLAASFRRRLAGRWRLVAGGLALWMGLGLVLSVSRGAWLGLVLALAAWPLCAGRRSWLWRVSVAVGVLAASGAALAVLYQTVPKVQQRMDSLVQDSGERTRPIMWRGAWEIFREHRVLGGGGGSYDTRFEAHRPEIYQDTPQWAHNDYLNTLADYGAVGFALFFGAAAWIVGRCWRGGKDRSVTSLVERTEERSAEVWLAPAVGVGLLAFAVQLFVDFHLKIPALAMALATTGGLVVRERWPQAASMGGLSGWSRGGALALALAVVALTGGWVGPLFRAEALRYAARERIDRVDEIVGEALQRERLVAARAALERALELDAANAQAWADLALAHEKLAVLEPARHKELGVLAETAAERALALAEGVPEFWVRAGVALDLQGRWYAGGERFVEVLRLAPNRSTSWYFQAHHLSLSPPWRAAARSAVGVSLRLDPGNRASIQLREHLAASGSSP